MALVVALLCGLAVALLLHDATRRPAQVLGSSGRRCPPGRSSPGGAAPAASGGGPATVRRLACTLAGLALAVVLPPVVGLPAGAAAAVLGPGLLARLEPASVRRERERLRADLPLVLDLLAACLAGGASLPGAAAAVGDAVDGPAGRRLARVATALHVGAPPSTAWLLLAGDRPDDDPLGAAARSLARAADSGAAVAAALTRLADDARSQSRSAGAAAARRAGVLAVAPLGLCFLPAFVLLGVVPVVLGLAAPVLGLR